MRKKSRRRDVKGEGEERDVSGGSELCSAWGWSSLAGLCVSGDESEGIIMVPFIDSEK